MRRSTRLHFLGSAFIGVAFAILFPNDIILSIGLTAAVVSIFSVALLIATRLGKQRSQSRTGSDISELIDQIAHREEQQQEPIYVESEVEDNE